MITAKELQTQTLALQRLDEALLMTDLALQVGFEALEAPENHAEVEFLKDGLKSLLSDKAELSELRAQLVLHLIH